MAWVEIAKVAAEVAKEAAKETAKETAKAVEKSAKALDARKPVETLGPKGEKLKTIDSLDKQVNLDKRIPRDVSKVKCGVMLSDNLAGLL